MIQTQTEKFTARDAVNAGLIEAIKRGETKLECHVAVEKGDLNFNQRNLRRCIHKKIWYNTIIMREKYSTDLTAMGNNCSAF